MNSSGASYRHHRPAYATEDSCKGEKGTRGDQGIKGAKEEPIELKTELLKLLRNDQDFAKSFRKLVLERNNDLPYDGHTTNPLIDVRIDN